MYALSELSKLKLDQFAHRFRAESIPLGTAFSYFCASMPLAEDEFKEYLEEPIAALPPQIAAMLPSIFICLVPYLEMAAMKKKAMKAGDQIVSMDKPADNRRLSVAHMPDGKQMVLAFGIKDTEMADYHYHFYRSISTLVSGELEPAQMVQYCDLIAAEFRAQAHGEVDEASWELKDHLMAHGGKFKGTSKSSAEYASQSFVDTLTLYLHGLCCDIDVEPGPRQLRTSYLRKRLQLLKAMFPPGEGFAIFPEDEKPDTCLF